MTNSLVLKLALRFVRSRRKGALTRFISFAATCGIAIGVFAAIVGLSAMNGFEYELENRVLSIIPSAQLNSSRSSFNDSLDIERTLRQSPHILATAPVQVLIRIKSAKSLRSSALSVPISSVCLLIMKAESLVYAAQKMVSRQLMWQLCILILRASSHS